MFIDVQRLQYCAFEWLGAWLLGQRRSGIDTHILHCCQRVTVCSAGHQHTQPYCPRVLLALALDGCIAAAAVSELLWQSRPLPDMYSEVTCVETAVSEGILVIWLP